MPGRYIIARVVRSIFFLCKGQVGGGYYADPEAECQVGTSLLKCSLRFLCKGQVDSGTSVGLF